MAAAAPYFLAAEATDRGEERRNGAASLALPDGPLATAGPAIRGVGPCYEAMISPMWVE